MFHLVDESAATTLLSLVLLASGALSVGVGYAHFRAADRAIRAGEMMPTNGLVFIVLTAVVVLAAVAAVATVLV